MTKITTASIMLFLAVFIFTYFDLTIMFLLMPFIGYFIGWFVAWNFDKENCKIEIN